MTVDHGDAVPSIVLTATDGRSVDLAALRGEATLLIFLRHLG